VVEGARAPRRSLVRRPVLGSTHCPARRAPHPLRQDTRAGQGMGAPQRRTQRRAGIPHPHPRRHRHPRRSDLRFSVEKRPSITVAPHSAPTRKSRRKATPMDDDGKTVEVFLPSSLTAREVGHHARSTIRMIATKAGDFVGDIKIGPGIHQGDGWCRWTAQYRPAPPESSSTRCSNEVSAAEARSASRRRRRLVRLSSGTSAPRPHPVRLAR